MANLVILFARAGSRVTAAFGGIMIYPSHPQVAATKGVAKPDVVDGRGMEVARWVMTALVATCGVGLPLVAIMATTSTTSNDGGTLAQDGTA